MKKSRAKLREMTWGEREKEGEGGELPDKWW